MIIEKPLTEQQQKASQFNYNCFNAINGISYMCLGETVMILLAVKMNSTDFTVSALGSMLYVGYLLLPLGKMVAAKWGGAYTQSFFWICRNVAALMVAVAGVLSYFNWKISAVIFLLAGSFFFYGFRAAGVVMSQPLVGDITNDKNRGRFIAITNGIFFLARMITILAIALTTKYSDNLWTLVGIIVFGAVCGISSSKFMRNVTETTAIRDSARKPLAPEIKWGLRDLTMRRQLYAGFVLSFASTMVIPISTLAVKRGYSVSDSDALFFTVSLSAGASIMGFFSSRLVKYIGPRKEMMICQMICILCALSWYILPDKLPYVFMLFYFFLLGTVPVLVMGAPVHYFLQTVSSEHRVGGSVLLAVVTGVPSGIAGMLVTGTLLELVPSFVSTPLDGYKLYFLITGLFLVPGFFIVRSLTPLPEDKRSRPYEWILMRISGFLSPRH